MIRGATALAVSLLAGAALGAVALPTSAAADAAGPTDYRSEVVDVDPPVDTVTVTIEGGDAFVLLAVDPGTEVVVVGYEGEPYLWFRPDGTVAENRRSPAAFVNEERYGGDVPASASATAEPEWIDVADGGRYAWHDHRAHRMETFAPVNVERGARVLDGVVPLVVDGTEVDVRVVSTWMPAPSRWPVALGALSGVLVVAGGHRLLRRRGIGVLVLAAAATTVGWVQFRSLPAETEPSPSWWLVPAAATVIAAVGVVLRRPPVPAATTAVAGLQLAGWAWSRRDGLWRSVLPTDVPFWLDRAVTAAALTGGAVAAALAVAALVRPAWTPRRSRPAAARATSAPGAPS